MYALWYVSNFIFYGRLRYYLYALHYFILLPLCYTVYLGEDLSLTSPSRCICFLLSLLSYLFNLIINLVARCARTELMCWDVTYLLLNTCLCILLCWFIYSMLVYLLLRRCTSWVSYPRIYILLFILLFLYIKLFSFCCGYLL